MSCFVYNDNVELRDQIIFGDYDKRRYFGGIARFNGVSLSTLIALARCEFLDFNEGQYNAPDNGSIMQFMANFSGYTAHGYVVSIERDGYRLSIEGVEKNGEITAEEKQAFLELFGEASEMVTEPNYHYCRFD